MLITHMQDLQEVTHDLHYENFRAQVLKNGGGPGMGNQSMSSINGSGDHGHGQNGQMNESDSLEAKEQEIQRMKEMMAKMQRELAIQQQMTQNSAVMNSMEMMGHNGHSHTINGHVSASPGAKHRPPPPPRRVDGSSYSRSNLDV